MWVGESESNVRKMDHCRYSAFFAKKERARGNPIPATIMPFLTTICVIFLIYTLQDKGPVLFATMFGKLISGSASG